MPVTSEQFQPTALTPAAAPGAAPGAARARRPRADPNKVGVVLIHGIGTQKASETFLDWTRPVVGLLADWRRDHGFDVDPVRRSQYSFSGASLPFLELEIPASGDHPAQTWVVTEAWWATQMRPPKLSDVTGFLRHGLPRIARGIRAGYDEARDAWEGRGEEGGTPPGAGPGLARPLGARAQLLHRGNRRAGDLAATRPDLIWYDFWASYDPAP